MSLTSDDFPEPLTPVTQTNTPSGMSTVTFLRLLCFAPTIRSDLAVRRAALGGDRDLLRAGEVLRGEDSWVGEDLGRRARGDDLAAADAGAGAEVHEVVRGPHRLLVVLDDEDGVAHVAEPFEARQQAGVVARVQADARLVEDVQHADEPAADLPGEADALGLAAGERRGRAVEREVVQSDVQQEPEPGANLLEQFAGDRPSAVGDSAFSYSSNHGTRSPIGMCPSSIERLARRRARPAPAG